MLPALDISTSALVAQRIRMNAISGNLANMSTTRNEAGDLEPYQPRFTIFKSDDEVGAYGASGVKVSSVEIEELEPLYKYHGGGQGLRGQPGCNRDLQGPGEPDPEDHCVRRGVWFPSSSLGTWRTIAVSRQSSVPKPELGNQRKPADTEYREVI